MSLHQKVSIGAPTPSGCPFVTPVWQMGLCHQIPKHAASPLFTPPLKPLKTHLFLRLSSSSLQPGPSRQPSTPECHAKNETLQEESLESAALGQEIVEESASEQEQCPQDKQAGPGWWGSVMYETWALKKLGLVGYREGRSPSPLTCVF